MVCCLYWHQPAVVLSLLTECLSTELQRSGGKLFRIRACELCRSFVCAVYWVTGRRSEIVLKQLLPVLRS